MMGLTVTLSVNAQSIIIAAIKLVMEEVPPDNLAHDGMREGMAEAVYKLTVNTPNSRAEAVAIWPGIIKHWPEEGRQ